MQRVTANRARAIAGRTADIALDRTIAPGYSRIGFAVRRRLWSGDDPPPHALDGKTALVTGATSGIGTATVEQLVALGAEVVILVRDTRKAAAIRESIIRHHPGADIAIEQCDVSDLDAVRRTGRRLRERLPRLDVLVHNAGVLPEDRQESAQGHEQTLATHVLGPILLTRECLPLLDNSDAPRVVFVSSGGMYTQRLHVDDLEYAAGEYRGATAYARTKRMQVTLLPFLAEEWSPRRVFVAAMHPGWVDTPGVASSLPGFHRLAGPILRTAEEGADTITWLSATDQGLPNGRFWHDRRVRPFHYLPVTRSSDAERLTLWRFIRQSLERRPPTDSADDM